MKNREFSFTSNTLIVQLVRVDSFDEIGHFQDAATRCFKTRPSAKPGLEIESSRVQVRAAGSLCSVIGQDILLSDVLSFFYSFTSANIILNSYYFLS